MSREVAKRSLWVNRVFSQLPAGQDASNESSSPLEKEKSRRLEHLHNTLKVTTFDMYMEIHT